MTSMTRSPSARESRQVIGGVDTHAQTHHAAVIDAATGKLLDDHEFPASGRGYQLLLQWLTGFGVVVGVGVEGTGSYGVGLFRHLHGNGVHVVEVARPNRQQRRLNGKSDPIDAISAARAVLAETAATVPKHRDGAVEVIRLVRTTRRSASRARRAAIQQIHAVLVVAPEALRRRLAGLNRATLVERCHKLRLTPTGAFDDPAHVAKAMLKRLAKRVKDLDAEIAAADAELHDLIEANAPTLLKVNAVGTEAAGQILVTAGQNAGRIRSEAALARICGVAPIPASSGGTTRHRLHRGGDRHANAAIHMIVMSRLRWHDPTKAYVARRTTEGKTKKEIIRCLKRAVVRELFHALRADLPSLNPAI